MEGRGIAVKLELDAIDFVGSQCAWHSPCIGASGRVKGAYIASVRLRQWIHQDSLAMVSPIWSVVLLAPASRTSEIFPAGSEEVQVMVKVDPAAMTSLRAGAVMTSKPAV